MTDLAKHANNWANSHQAAIDGEKQVIAGALAVLAPALASLQPIIQGVAGVESYTATLIVQQGEITTSIVDQLSKRLAHLTPAVQAESEAAGEDIGD